MENLITKTDAYSLLGITAAKFSSLQIKPTKTTKNPYRRGMLIYLYRRADILALKDTAQIIAIQPKTYLPKDYAPIFIKKYANRANALQDVCFGLFNLNRYAKHRQCSQKNKEEIYDIKSALIKYLYLNGYCIDVQYHTKFGYKEGWFNRNTNEYEEGYDWENNFYSFTFNICGITYNWHQPEEKMAFSINSISSTKEIDNITKNKPLEVKRAKLKEYKELINWFLSQR